MESPIWVLKMFNDSKKTMRKKMMNNFFDIEIKRHE